VVFILFLQTGTPVSSTDESMRTMDLSSEFMGG